MVSLTSEICPGPAERGEVDARLDDLAPWSTQVVPLRVGARDSRLRVRSRCLEHHDDSKHAPSAYGSGGGR